MKLNIIQILWKNNYHSPFWILISRGYKKKLKRTSRGYNESNKFYILDETKHNPANFDILYFIIPK